MLDYVGNPDTVLFQITSWIGDTSSSTGSAPLRDFLVQTPWFVVLAGLTAIALVVSGLRPAVTTFLMLGLIGVIGQWEPAMDTLSQVLVATVLAVALGLGARHPGRPRAGPFSRALRPVNDVLQTLPQLVYLIPFIYLMPVSIVPGMIAGVLYAFPIVVRLVERRAPERRAERRRGRHAFGATAGRCCRRSRSRWRRTRSCSA